MESWRHVFRVGLAPLLTVPQLQALERGLLDDDPALLQKATTSPPPLQCVSDWPVEGCCPVSYTGWKSGLATVGEVETYFAQMCYQMDQNLGEPAGCRWLLNWIDEEDRAEMRRELLGEVERELSNRRAQAG